MFVSQEPLVLIALLVPTKKRRFRAAKQENSVILASTGLTP